MSTDRQTHTHTRCYSDCLFSVTDCVGGCNATGVLLWAMAGVSILLYLKKGNNSSVNRVQML